MVHGNIPSKYSWTLEELTVEIGNLKYDSLRDFFALLSQKILEDSEADKWRWRIQLSIKLRELSDKLKDAELLSDEIWNICEPYMKQK